MNSMYEQKALSEVMQMLEATPDNSTANFLVNR